MIQGYLQTMWQATDDVSGEWGERACVDLLIEMRRIALLILTRTLFGDDVGPHLDDLWTSILRTIHYISPGPWLVWPTIPRVGYRQALQRLDGYLSRIITHRHASPDTTGDLLGSLITSGMDDGLIRDQLLTMFIAGHDTSTALLAWSLYLLSIHPDVLARVQTEMEEVVGTQPPTYAQLRQLGYLDRVIKETLRLYPPIHLGSRIAATELVFRNYHIPAGTRVLYSLYLTHRDKKYWPAPDRFDPDRFAPEHAHNRPAYAYLPFGGGPRNCMGAAFAQVEAKIVLARLLQRYDFQFVGGKVRPHMRATLEPHPRVLVTVRPLT
jgi:cytochrome P450